MRITPRGAATPFARKRFGQHFLEAAWVEKVLRAINPQPDQTFIEIGPGRGALTRPLLDRSRSVVAFEIDRELASDLTASGLPHLTIVEGDFLESTWFDTHDMASPPLAGLSLAGPGHGAGPVPSDGSSPEGGLRVAGNLPYNVASPILFRLAALHAGGLRFADATLMLQREVADRLIAEPGTHEYGVLAILIRHVADVELLFALPPGAFRPAPRVRSALVRVRFRDPRPPAKDQAIFTGLVRAMFTRRRKMLSNALLAFTPVPNATRPVTGSEALERSGIDGRRRPETLSIPELVSLADAYAS